MAELKKIALKGLLLIGLLVGLDRVYVHFQLQEDAKQHSQSAWIMMAAQDTSDLIYIGESSNVTTSDMDMDKRSISQMLAAHYPQLRVGNPNRGAIHAGNFYWMLRSIPRNSPIQTVVLTMNLRSFGQGWIRSKLESALQKEMLLLRPYPWLANRFLLSLAHIEEIGEGRRNWEIKAAWLHDTLHFPQPQPFSNVVDWDYYQFMKGVPGADGKRDEAATALACHFIKNYGFQLDPLTNPRIHDFDRIVALCHDRGWHLVLNLLPENVALARSLVGDELAEMMRANRDLLQIRYADLPDVVFVDQLEALKPERFTDKTLPAEHYDAAGRLTVARGVAKALQKWYPGPLPMLEMQKVLRRHFENDCEGGTVWMQMNTLDETQAHSGKKSSLTSPEKGSFGVTLSYPVDELDSNAMDSLHVNCWVYRSAAVTKAEIAWEIGGEQIPYEFMAVSLDSMTREPNRWEQVDFRAALPEAIRQADLVKVYPYNPAKIPVWFDDIRIEFVGK